MTRLRSSSPVEVGAERVGRGDVEARGVWFIAFLYAREPLFRRSLGRVVRSFAEINRKVEPGTGGIRVAGGQLQHVVRPDPSYGLFVAD